ncbi:hypothetical protein SteCoe_9607 [Stentor coeruleus]|uniref:Uncharacterized protein n=1 Tax=Stentor coeruleus TaxID=5963 RepID=A0A1R2CHK8_9CILI|nr:hypothetical protein SteCoe_9607 [Stentor coeruleus]
MSSKFLERFRASIEQKTSIYSTINPISKKLNPAQLHDPGSSQDYYTDFPTEPSVPNRLGLKTIITRRKLIKSPSPVLEKIIQPFDRKLLPIKSVKEYTKSASRTRKVKSDVNRSYDSPSFDLKNEKSYSPYSWKDYKNIKPTKYMLLGGLGPNIGHENWKKANEKKQKMIDYWREVKEKNYA